MSGSNGLPPEMSRRPGARAADPLRLDDTTASRLLDRTIDAADAPPGYGSVVAVLGAAAGPVRPEERAGSPPSLAAVRSAASSRPSRRRRSVRLAALVGVGVLALGGVAAAATGALPGGAQTVAHDALGAVGVSVPAPPSSRARATVPPRRPVPAPAPRTARPVVPRAPVPTPPRPHPVTTAPSAPPPRSPPLTPRPVPPSPGAAALCRAAAAGRLSPSGHGVAARAEEALAGLTHGAANIPEYCRGVLGEP